MAAREKIIAFCDELLQADAFADYGPNGLQVPGAAEVSRVATAVSAHRESIEAAVACGAQLLLAHHGLFWDSQPRSITAPMAARLRAVFDASLSIAAYHLPLDAHPQIGNNALLCEALGFARTDVPLGEVRGNAIGVVGSREEPVEATALFARVEEVTARSPLVFDAGPERVERIGIISGGGSSGLAEAVALGLDAFCTGEPSEYVMADAREGGIHFIVAGHYATETFGIRRLGELVAERFGVEHDFIDVPNPI